MTRSTTFRSDPTSFCIEIAFRPGSKNPERVFLAMSALLGAFRDLDEALLASISGSIDTEFVLEEIESGSIKTWIRTSLNAVDDSALGDLDWKKIVGGFLVGAKHRILEFVDEEQPIDRPEAIVALRNEIVAQAEQTNVLAIPAYQPVTPGRLIQSMGRISTSVALLDDEDEVNFISQSNVVRITPGFSVSPEFSMDLETERVVDGTSEMILKVKKPDFLGSSMWSFKYLKKSIQAKVTDDDWLDRFHLREEIVQPGDSLRTLVRYELRYDEYGELVSERYWIIKVLAVYQTPRNPQPRLLS